MIKTVRIKTAKVPSGKKKNQWKVKPNKAKDQSSRSRSDEPEKEQPLSALKIPPPKFNLIPDPEFAVEIWAGQLVLDGEKFPGKIFGLDDKM